METVSNNKQEKKPEKRYAVQIVKSGRFVEWCDEHWFGAVYYPLYKYALKEAVHICVLMQNHYTYQLNILDENARVVKHIDWIQRHRLSREQRKKAESQKRFHLSVNKLRGLRLPRKKVAE